MVRIFLLGLLLLCAAPVSAQYDDNFRFRQEQDRMRQEIEEQRREQDRLRYQLQEQERRERMRRQQEDSPYGRSLINPRGRGGAGRSLLNP